MGKVVGRGAGAENGRGLLSLCGYEAVNHFGIVYVFVGSTWHLLLLNLINPSIDGLSSLTYHLLSPPNLGEWPNAYCHLTDCVTTHLILILIFFFSCSCNPSSVYGPNLFDYRACRNTNPLTGPLTVRPLGTGSLDTSTEQAPIPHGLGTTHASSPTQVRWYQITTSTVTNAPSQAYVPYIEAPPYPI